MKWIILPMLALLLNGCSSIYYLYQAGRGQMVLLNRGKPIEQVIHDPKTDPKLASLLSKMDDIRKFCDESGLKQTPNYREYVKLDRDSVVYVVTVSEALEFKPKIFSFPIAGSFNYIGWFNRDDAIAFGKRFKDEGKDVDIRGAAAYSTLGWFKDPLLSTMIPIENGTIQTEAFAELVNVLIHESVHATLYIDHQSNFNESLAVFVADELTRRYFESRQLDQGEEWKSYQQYRDRMKKVRQRLMKAYDDLEQIYGSSLDPKEKMARKQAYLAETQKETKMKRPINNATLIQVRTYDDSDHGFQELFQRLGHDMGAFLKALSALRSKDFDEEHSEKFNVSKMVK